MTQILVTGARGFVGRALLEEFETRPISVRAVSRSAQKGEAAAAVSTVQWITLTIAPDTDWAAALTGVDCVIHLADGLRAFEKPDKANPPDGPRLIDSTTHLFKAAQEAGVKRFIYVSSIKAAAGETGTHILSEEMEPQPSSAYGRMKLECENALTGLAEKGGMELIIIRNPIVYGPGATNNMARLLRLADKPWPLPFAALENRRSIISARNLASALAAAALHEGAASGTYYVHDGERLSTGEMIAAMRQALGRRPRLFALPESFWPLCARLPGLAKTVRRLTGSLLVTDRKFRKQFSWEAAESASDALADMAKAYAGGKSAP